MNQPKFKFGEKVLHNGKWFIVGAIHYSKETGGFKYNSEAQIYHWMPESELEFYHDPKKKKLYAYTNHPLSRGGEVKFFHVEKLEGDFLFRVPEYDLDFSLGYACAEKPL